MTAVVLLLIVILASFLCVRAGAIALELTGMDADKARFQALSAFTNTGFTTREAEEITLYPMRRKIISIIIVLGHAGTVSVIASFATSLLQKNLLDVGINLMAILGGLYLLYLLARSQGVTLKVAEYLRRWLLSRFHLSATSLEQMLLVTEGVGVVRVEIKEDSLLLHKTLMALPLKAKKVQILSIKRGNNVIAVPAGEDHLEAGDSLICYGDTKSVREFFA